MDDTTKSLIKSFVWILGIFVIFITINGYINHKIDKRMNSPEFINEIAKKIRPMVIFDGNNVIDKDMGAMKFIEKIEVIKTEPLSPINQDYKIIITPKEHLPYAPLIETINAYGFIIKSNRGKGHRWEYELDNYSQSDRDPPKFKLEILN